MPPLYHLSGDYGMGKTKKSKSEKKAAKKQKKSTKKSERKTKVKKIAKVALAPARGAFITVVSLNFLKMGTKLARIWKKEGGQAALNKFWLQFGGDINKLKKAIAKGSKQSISGAEMGVVGTTLVATATPIIIKIVDLLKKFKASGDNKEEKEFNDGVDKGVKELATNPDFEKSTAEMPEDADVAKVKTNPAEDNSKADESKDHDKGDHNEESSLANALGFCFKTLLIIPMMHINNPFLFFIASILGLYCLIGFMFVQPVIYLNLLGYGKAAKKYFSIPYNYIINLKRSIFKTQ